MSCELNKNRIWFCDKLKYCWIMWIVSNSVNHKSLSIIIYVEALQEMAYTIGIASLVRTCLWILWTLLCTLYALALHGWKTTS